MVFIIMSASYNSLKTPTANGWQSKYRTESRKKNQKTNHPNEIFLFIS